MENKDANSLGVTLLDRNDGLQTARGSSRSNGVALYAPPTRHGGSRQASGARRQVKVASNNARVGAVLLFVGGVAFAAGMAIHSSEAHHLVSNAPVSSLEVMSSPHAGIVLVRRSARSHRRKSAGCAETASPDRRSRYSPGYWSGWTRPRRTQHRPGWGRSPSSGRYRDRATGAPE